METDTKSLDTLKSIACEAIDQTAGKYDIQGII